MQKHHGLHLENIITISFYCMMDKKKFTSKKSRGEMDGKIAGLYDLEETIGKGHFAVVKLARHVFTNEKVAVKVIDKTKLDEVSKSHLFQEVRCMKLVQHPNVVRLYEVIDTQTKLYLILELGDGGDMYDYIMKHEKGLTEEIARRYFKQIVEAISYCHRLHVVHRDLKPENVVFFEKLGCVKLTDFGFSNMFNPGKKLETSCGSLAYSAPEILLGDSYDAPAVDVWSLGVILYMLVCGEPPFQEANDSETLTMIMDCKYSIPIHISTECNDLICRMLIRDPGHRACLEDIVSHPWLRSGDYIPPTMPLISREHLSDEDHNYLIDKMVEGNIATKDEVLQSLDKDLYDHITATYYLLAERKLKKQHMEHAATLSNLRKHSAPGEHPSYHHTHKPQLEPLALSPRIQTKDSDHHVEERPQRPKTTTSIVDSLLSPPGTHPSSSPSLGVEAAGLVPRKYSLIQEESFDDEENDEEFMDTECDLRPAKSAESLDDCAKRSSTTGSHTTNYDSFNLKRPLLSVASSPQLLNQICEENESDCDEEDDFVPSKLSSPRLRLSRGSCASPEVLRKYEQRKKRRGAGSRGTSCSSSDASDTDDTEGRSRKDKLKQKFMHRRDSSDHSSDTDGGPTGPTGGLGGSRGMTGGGGGGKERNNKDRKGGGGGQKGNKDGKSGGGKGKQNGLVRDGDVLNLSQTLSSLSLSSMNSKSGLKYIVERNESEVDESDIEDEGLVIESFSDRFREGHYHHKNKSDGSSFVKSKTDSAVSLKNRLNSQNGDVSQKDFGQLADQENIIQDVQTGKNYSHISPHCKVGGFKDKNGCGHSIKVKMDINRNTCCKVENSKVQHIPVETRCCSLV